MANLATLSDLFQVIFILMSRASHNVSGGVFYGVFLTSNTIFISTSNFEPWIKTAYHKTDSVEIFTLALPENMCLKCFWLKVEHLDISESSSDWAEQRFQIEIWDKCESGGCL